MRLAFSKVRYILSIKNSKEFAQILWETIKSPLRLFFFILLIYITISLLKFPENIKILLNNIAKILLAINIAYFFIKLIDVIVKYLEPKILKTKSIFAEQLLPFLSKIIKGTIVIVAILITLDNIGYNIRSILTGLGIGGLAVALAAQDTLKNFFGSITLLLDRPFHIGDIVQVEGIDGSVDAIGFRSTRIKTSDSTLVTMPNSKLADTTINNITKRNNIKNLYTIGIRYDTKTEKLKEALQIIRTILKNHPSTDNYLVYFKSFGAYSLNILVIHWCKFLVYEQFLISTEEINLKIKEEFEKAAIEFAFPSQTIYMQNLQNPA